MELISPSLSLCKVQHLYPWVESYVFTVGFHCSDSEQIKLCHLQSGHSQRGGDHDNNMKRVFVLLDRSCMKVMQCYDNVNTKERFAKNIIHRKRKQDKLIRLCKAEWVRKCIGFIRWMYVCDMTQQRWFNYCTLNDDGTALILLLLSFTLLFLLDRLDSFDDVDIAVNCYWWLRRKSISSVKRPYHVQYSGCWQIGLLLSGFYLFLSFHDKERKTRFVKRGAL